MDESQRHYAKWKKPDTKDDTMNDLLIQNSRKDKTKKKKISGCQNYDFKGTWANPGGEGSNGNILSQLHRMAGYTTVYIC